MRGLLILLSCVLALAFCSKTSLAEDGFDYAGTGPHKIAVLPVEHELPLNVDSVYRYAMIDQNLQNDLLDPIGIRARMDSLGAKDVVGEMLDLDPKSAKGSKIKSFANHLDSAQADLLRQVCAGADLVLVPADFSMKKKAGAVAGKVTHRLYDLKTGNLLYDEKESVNMMADGTARSGGLMSLMGGGGKIKEEDRPRALVATLSIVGDGLRHLKEKVVLGK